MNVRKVAAKPHLEQQRSQSDRRHHDQCYRTEKSIRPVSYTHLDVYKRQQQSILQSQEQVQKLTEELAAKKEADRQKAWAQISQRGDNYEPSNSIVKKCIDGSIGFHVELSCEQAYGTQEAS